MRYVVAEFQEKEALMAYRIYVSDCLKATVSNTVTFGGHNIEERFYDYISKNKVNDERTADEVISDIKSKMDKFFN